MTTTRSQALQAMISHHRVLTREVTRRIDTIATAVDRDGNFDVEVGDLVGYLAQEVLPHATAEEQTVYTAARSLPGLDEPVAGLIDEHRHLATAVERLATAATGADARAAAEGIGSLFAGHVRKEDELILPALANDPAVDLSTLLAQTQRLTEAAQASPAGEDTATGDLDSRLYRLLVDAVNELAGAGKGDRACRLMASAWASLRTARPDLAVRSTAVLHRLVRSVTEEPVILSSGHARPRLAGDGAATLDVRPLAPAQRHEKIFAAYGALGSGSSFVLVNDHDPKPLRYQFDAEHREDHTWDVLEDGPEVWRVRIGRPASAPAEAEPELDVRRFPHGQRHDVIFTTYSGLTPGGGFVLVNDHDPKPLRYQFEAQYSGEYSWDYIESGPSLWRVRIGRIAVGAKL